MSSDKYSQSQPTSLSINITPIRTNIIDEHLNTQSSHTQSHTQSHTNTYKDTHTDTQSYDQIDQNNLNPYTNNQKQYKNFLFSHVLDQTFFQQQSYSTDPQLTRIKNNILLILLGLSAYGIYYLIGDFIDYIILGYIVGLAYHQTRGKFIRIIMNPLTYKGYSQSIYKRICKALALFGFAFILPRLRYILSNPQQFKNIFKLKNYILSFWLNKNLTVILCQIFSTLCALYMLLGPHLKKIGQKLRPTNVTCVRWTFGFITIFITLSIIALIPTVLFKQIGQVGILIQQKIQQKFTCQIISFSYHTNHSLPLCSQKYLTSNIIIKQTIQQFKNQNQTVQACKQDIKQFQLNYIGYNIFHYDDIVCTWYSIITKASNYSAIQSHKSQISQISTVSLFSTGTSIFKNIFGNLTWIIIGLSNILFYFTIMITVFVLTTKISSNRYFTIKQIFSQNKRQLISQITSLIQATCLIVFWHFVVSLILLEIFAYTGINLIIAIILSSMAFLPIFRPWFGIVFVAIFRIIFLKQYYISIIFLGIYYHVSEYIYSFHYQKMQIHQIIINMSVLFGIYRFGISGIIYGPLIIIIYSCIEKQLLIKYIKKQKKQKKQKIDRELKNIQKLKNQQKRLSQDQWQKLREIQLEQKKKISIKQFSQSQEDIDKKISSQEQNSAQFNIQKNILDKNLSKDSQEKLKTNMEKKDSTSFDKKLFQAFDQ